MPRSRSPVVERRRLAAALRELRERSRLTLEEAASRAIDASGAKLSRIENGKQLVSPRDVRDLCHLYEVPPARLDELVAMAEAAREPGLRESYDINDDDFLDLESDAVRVDEYQMGYVPSLLQTPDYVRAMQGRLINQGRLEPWAPHEIDEWLEIRLARQQVVRPDSEAYLRFVIDEAVLSRMIGGPYVMRDQYRHLAQLASQPNIVIQVLPLEAGGNAGQFGGFILLTGSDHGETGYIESQGGNQFVDGDFELSRLRRIFAQLTELSRSADDSQRILAELAASIPS